MSLVEDNDSALETQFAPAGPSSLCEHCSVMFSLDPGPDYQYGFHRIPDGRTDTQSEYPKFTASIETGCQACRLLRRASRQEIDHQRKYFCSMGYHLDDRFSESVLIETFNKNFIPSSTAGRAQWQLDGVKIIVHSHGSKEMIFHIKIHLFADEGWCHRLMKGRILTLNR